MTKKHWYKLDNVGNFYSLTNNSTIPAVFRYSVTLKDNVDSKILQQALEQSLNYFPNFNCHLKKGFFWLYLEASDKKVYVAKENKPIFNIEATIYCLKDSHKGIIIGKDGAMLKKIGTYARQDLEKILEERVNLKIWVKVKEDWVNNESFVKKFKKQD